MCAGVCGNAMYACTYVNVIVRPARMDMSECMFQFLFIFIHPYEFLECAKMTVCLPLESGLSTLCFLCKVEECRQQRHGALFFWLDLPGCSIEMHESFVYFASNHIKYSLKRTQCNFSQLTLSFFLQTSIF